VNWAHFYLACFAVGFAFSLLSFLSGVLQVHWHLPLPHWLHGGAGHAVHGHAHLHAGSAELSPLNLATVSAFLAWFGGTGYLLTRYSSVWFAAGLLLATVAGLVSAGGVFVFMSRVLMSKEAHMNSEDYEMVGVLGRISSIVREGGTGELIYSQAGTRRSCGVRSDDGSPLDKNTEVIVTRFEKGIAYVRRWVEMAGEE
jgi:membrane protein implicated in regulation of membrane protease activity